MTDVFCTVSLSCLKLLEKWHLSIYVIASLINVKFTITTLAAKMTYKLPLREQDLRHSLFFIEIANKYNELSQHFDISGISLATFKMKCKKYLLSNENILNHT